MDTLGAIIATSILIGIAIGWPIGYWRCKQHYASICKTVTGMVKEGGVRCTSSCTKDEPKQN